MAAPHTIVPATLPETGAKFAPGVCDPDHGRFAKTAFAVGLEHGGSG